jgi:ribosomal protein S18 acetylase RimI-like enzyme
MDIRPADPADDAVLGVLLQQYMREVHSAPWEGSLEGLSQAREDGNLHIVVCGEVGRPVAFAAWLTSWDLHRCVSGGEILDVYVSPWDRGRGIAARLVMRIAADVQLQGGRYLRGKALERGSATRLYQRVAVSYPGANISVSGRAFRALAALSGANPREIVANLPDRTWNEED